MAKTKNPILEPEAEYETDGFFGDVVFACGLTVKGDRVRIYYGAADTSLAAVDLSLNEIMAQLSDV